MTNPFAKQSAALAAALTLLSGGNAYADTAAVATVMATATSSVSTPGIVNSPTGIVLAANSRETNLQKTPTSIIVSGIESASKRRAQK